MAGETLTQEEVKLLNEAVFEKLGSRDPVLEKQALDAINDFTRIRMREDGFFRRIMPPIPISNDDFDRAVDTTEAVKVVDKEMESPAAISVPLNTLPQSLYIKGPRYRVHFDRIMTTRFTADVDTLRTWMMDIRQVLSDNAIKDMLAEEDAKFLRAVNSALRAKDSVVPTSGTVQWEGISSDITRDSLWDSRKIMPNTPFSLEPKVALLNSITILDVCKIAYDEMGGGEVSADVMKNGWTLQNFMGIDWIVTIKKGLVPTGTIYYFCDPQFLGKHYMVEDTVLYAKREAFMLEFFAYQYSGASIGHTAGLARADFE